MIVAELIQALQKQDPTLRVGMGFEGGIRMEAEYVGTAIVDEWGDDYTPQTLVVITSMYEVGFIDELS